MVDVVTKSINANILIGHVLDRLRGLPDKSIHCIVTSPPYYGLRDYGLEPVIWEPVRHAPMTGVQEMAQPAWSAPERFAGCDHTWNEWTETHDVRETSTHGKSRTTDRCYGDQALRKFNGNHEKHTRRQFCEKCGAWRGCLGLEPDPALYIGHLVQVFRAAKRVLRDGGTFWLNLGDSYASGNRKTRDVDKKEEFTLDYRLEPLPRGYFETPYSGYLTPVQHGATSHE
jgi:DNA modification methylase